MQALYALYSDPDSAQQAVDALRSSNGSASVDNDLRDHIAVISSEPFDGYDFFHRDHKTIMPWIAAAGGLVGGVCGFLFAAYTQAVYPIPTSGMPIVPLYADGVITYELTMLGAVLATLFTLLLTARLPNWKRKLYDPEISDGKILVGVIDPPDSARAVIADALRGAGAGQVKEFSL